MDRFIAFLKEYPDLPDDMLEPKLRTCIAETVIPNLLTLWDSRRDSASWKLEHEQVPPQAKKWMGMAPLGVQTWKLDLLPFEKIGRLLLSAGGRAFDDVYGEFSSLLPHRKKAPGDQGFVDDYGFERYSLTHKLRSLASRLILKRTLQEICFLLA